MKNIAWALLITLMAFITPQPAGCQNPEVKYNLFNDSITCFKNGKPLKTPRLRKGEAVNIVVTEFNPFLYDIELKLEEAIRSDGGGIAGVAAMTGFMPGISGLMGAGFAGGQQESSGGMPLLDVPLLTLNDSPITLRGLFERSRGNAELMDQTNRTMREISFLVEDVQMTHAALKESEKAVRVSQLALANVGNIKLHRGIRPSLIKKMCSEYYAAVFQKTTEEDLSLDDLLTWQDLPARHEWLLQKLRTKQGELTSKMNLLQAFSDQLTTLGLDDNDFKKYTRDLVDFQAKTRALNNQLKDGLGKTASPANLPSLQELAALQLELAEVMSSDFTWRSTVQPTADELVLVIRVLQKTDSASTADPVVVKERRLQMEVRGGLKVSASVGVNFGQFFSPGQSYSVSNGLIAGDDDGIFSPAIASFLHFYGYRGQRATLGGSFGIGFPVLAGSENQSVQFFLGPSLVMGARQKLVLSGGFMGGRVQRLAKGFKVGDPFDANNGDIPLKGKYELGAFVGLSFNLGN